MRVFICTDLEGISGITLFAQTRDPNGPHYPESRRLLMGDVNAAVAGARAGGATEVVVLDGHGNPLNFLPEMMVAEAEYICGRGFPTDWGIDANFDCGFLVGYHAMAHTPRAVLSHTQNSRSDARYWYNGREFGEIGQEAIIMGHFGVPITLVTGDVAACREATEFLGDGVVTVAVKEAYGRECCRMVAPRRAHEMIAAGAREAVAAVSRCQPFTIAMPIVGHLEGLETPLGDGPTPADLDSLPHKVYEKTFTHPLEILQFG